MNQLYIGMDDYSFDNHTHDSFATSLKCLIGIAKSHVAFLNHRAR